MISFLSYSHSSSKYLHDHQNTLSTWVLNQGSGSVGSSNVVNDRCYTIDIPTSSSYRLKYSFDKDFAFGYRLRIFGDQETDHKNSNESITPPLFMI